MLCGATGAMRFSCVAFGLRTFCFFCEIKKILIFFNFFEPFCFLMHLIYSEVFKTVIRSERKVVSLTKDIGEKIIAGSICDFIKENHMELKQHYYHYTKKKWIEKIFGNYKQIRLSPAHDLNDLNDSCENSYILCLSASKPESVPFWHLYSGIDGDGIRISFTEAVMEEIKTGELYYINEDEKIAITPEDVKLLPILYYDRYEKNNLHKIKIDGNVHYATSDQIKKYKTQNPGFTKTIEWDYEKEHRLLVKVSQSVAEAVGEKGLFFSIDKLQNGISVIVGPHGESINSNIYDPIRAFYDGKYNINKIKPSKLTGSVEMKLCRDCVFDELKEKDRINGKAKKT